MKKDPRDPAAREKLAAWYEANGCPGEAAAQRHKAAQCERFDPDFDYRQELAGVGLKAVHYAGGEIVCLTDGQGYEVYCDPQELQAWLLADGDKHLKDLPGEDWRPSQELLARVWPLLPVAYGDWECRDAGGGRVVGKDPSGDYYSWARRA